MLNLSGLSVNSFSGMTDAGQIILLVAALLVAFVVFKILAGLLRIVVTVVLVVCLWMLVLQPDWLSGELGNFSTIPSSNLSAK